MKKSAYISKNRLRELFFRLELAENEILTGLKIFLENIQGVITFK